MFDRLTIPVVLFLLHLSGLTASAALVSQDPSNGVGGVPTNYPCTFVFDLAVNTNGVVVEFVNGNTFAPLPVASSWSIDQRVLTCTPTPGFPSQIDVMWRVLGQNLMGQAVQVGGAFYSGTNAAVTPAPLPFFALSEVQSYRQDVSNGTLQTNAPFTFNASVIFPTNFPATNVSLTVSNLHVDVPATGPGTFAFATNAAAIEPPFAVGPHVFDVASPGSTQRVILGSGFPAGQLSVPPAQTIINYLAAQAVDPNQPFLLNWNYESSGFPNFIQVEIGHALRTPNAGEPGALFGNDHMLFIPPYVLQPGTTYECTLTLAKGGWDVNYTYDYAYPFRYEVLAMSKIHFTLTTTGTPIPLVLTNVSHAANLFSFNVRSAANTTFALESSATLQTNSWQTLLVTNSPNGQLRLNVPAPTNSPHLFFRARKLP